MPTKLIDIRRTGWSYNAPAAGQPAGLAAERTDVVCPYFPGQPVYESSSNNGQRASFDPPENRRTDIQALSLGEGWYCFDYAFRITVLPTFVAGEWGWNDLGPEIHDTLNQSPIQPQVLPCSSVGTQGTTTPRIDAALPAGGVRYFLDANAGRGPHRYFDLGPAPIGSRDADWSLFRMVVNYTADASKGVIRINRDGKLVREVRDATIAKAPAGWVKTANYGREAYVKGEQRYQIAGSIYRCANEADLPPMPTRAGTTPPVDPPPPPDLPDPCAGIRATLAQTVSDLNGAREARDQAINAERARAAERDAAVTDRDAAIAQNAATTLERDAARALALGLKDRLDRIAAIATGG